MKIAVIGGGAAGFFSAIHAKEKFKEAEVSIFDKSPNVLAKVKISGGGRCNVTSGIIYMKELVNAYPRGGKKLKAAFKKFDTRDTWNWFESKGVGLYVQQDQRVFPMSNKSQTIIDLFMSECKRLGIALKTSQGVAKIIPVEDGIKLEFVKEEFATETFDKVIVATGGSPKKNNYAWLEELGHEIIDPVPSLFTFNMPDEPIVDLMGVSVPDARVTIQGTKLHNQGPLLITHWGMSGPAILKLSAWAARDLAEIKYNFVIQVNWVNVKNDELVYAELEEIAASHPKKPISKQKAYGIPSRLWLYLMEKVGLEEDKPWGELGKKGLHKIRRILTNDTYDVKGKTTFKEEFVTCGGVSLESVDFNTMQSKSCPNLYFAGEVLDIDGVTGGFNFQSAWTTAFIAAQLED